MILSACSPFFRKILISNPHPHPLVYLKGISGPDLDAIVGFIYQVRCPSLLKALIFYYMQGETNVTEQQLDSFLSSAQELQVNDDHCDDHLYSTYPASRHWLLIENTFFMGRFSLSHGSKKHKTNETQCKIVINLSPGSGGGSPNGRWW